MRGLHALDRASVPIVIIGDTKGDDYPIYDGMTYRFTWTDGRTRGAFTGHTDRSKSVSSALWFWHEDASTYISVDPDHIRDIEEVV